MALIQLSMQCSSLNHSAPKSDPLGLPKSNPITQEQSIALVSCYARPQTRTMPVYECSMNHTQDYKAVIGDFQEAIYCSDQNSSTVDTSDHNHAIFLAMTLCYTYWSTCGIPLHMWRETRCRAKPIIFQLKVIHIDLTGLMIWHKHNLRSQGHISYPPEKMVLVPNANFPRILK